MTDSTPTLTRIARVRESISHQIEMCQKKLDDFRDHVNDSSRSLAYTLEWSAGAFENAAKLEVLERAIYIIDNEIERGEMTSAQQFHSMEKYALDQMTHGARYPSRSTSVQANEVATCRTAAIAEFYETIMWQAGGID